MFKSLPDRISTGWAITGLTLLLLLAVELSAHAILLLKTKRLESVDPRVFADAYEAADWVNEYFKEFHDSQRQAWYSYVYWRKKPFKGSYIDIDEMGIRRTWNQDGTEEKTLSSHIKIFMFGGSTMWGTGARDEFTIPSILSRLLKDKGLKVAVTNFGESGYVSSQEITMLMLELRRHHVPNLVIFYDGWNDVYAASQNGVSGSPMNEVNRQREFNILNSYDSSWPNRLFWEASQAFVKESATYRLLDGVLQKIGIRKSINISALLSHTKEADSEQLSDDVVQLYAENMKIVQQLAKVYGFKAIFFWQPTIFTKNTLSPYEEASSKEHRYFKEFFLETYVKAKQRLQQFDCFEDVSDMFVGTDRPYFIDSVHLAEAGNEIVAFRMLSNILRNIQPIVEAQVQQKTQGPNP